MTATLFELPTFGTKAARPPTLEHWVPVRSVEFCVSGIPQPQPAKGSFFNEKLNRGITYNKSGPWQQWRADVRTHAEAAMQGRAPFTGPLELILLIERPRPGKPPKTRPWGPALPIQKPDATNYGKNIEDALTGCVWLDDAQIVHHEVWKVYATGQCGVRVKVVELGLVETPPATL